LRVDASKNSEKDRLSTKLQIQRVLNLAFSIVFDEATDTASEDNAELVRPAVSLPPAPSPGWTLTPKLSVVVKDHAVSSHESYLQFLKDNVVSIPLHSEKLFLRVSILDPPRFASSNLHLLSRDEVVIRRTALRREQTLR